LPFIEIPINTNTSGLYNKETDCELCNNPQSKYNRLILYPYVEYHSSEITENVSTQCTKNSQCITNKCENNICTFNKNENITRCRHGRCGKLIGDPCESTFDCSDGECIGVCYIPIPHKVNELDSVFRFFEYLAIGILFAVIVLGLCCGYCYKRKITNFYKEFNND